MKVYLDTIGCRLNQSEIEMIASQFRAAGHSITSSPAGADLVVVNTCAVTASAASDSRQKIRQASRAAAGSVIATGCWSTLEPQAALDLPGVIRVVMNAEKERLVRDVLDLPEELYNCEPLVRQPLPGLHQRTRAFIKVQDGCDNYCTFCITRIARGASRSRPTAEVLRDIRAALDGGAQEIVLSGVQLGSWGHDFTQPRRLRHLVETILTETPVPRLRLSSLEPWDLDEDFFTLWQEARLCRHIHLPLQAGAEVTLRRMARKTRPSAYARLVELARRVSPDIAITTDILTGFPGESQSDFEEGLAYIESMQFAGGHVFPFSARPGTPASKYKDQVPVKMRKERSAILRAALAVSAERYARRFVDSELDVLWESADSLGPAGWRYHGLSDNYLRVHTEAQEQLWNQIRRVRLETWGQEGFSGNILPVLV
ncbi:MAG TPA: MiaB/RimO family radical SAM methylthiotransferase [Levilinea sp.]|nr:MiaB/RimO family radical SAM methylthiotransferase [Levilinea sp.]